MLNNIFPILYEVECGGIGEGKRNIWCWFLYSHSGFSEFLKLISVIIIIIIIIMFLSFK